MIDIQKSFEAELWHDDDVIGKIGPYYSKSGRNGLVDRCRSYFGKTMTNVSDDIKTRISASDNTRLNYVDTLVFDWDKTVTYWEITVTYSPNGVEPYTYGVTNSDDDEYLHE